MVKWRVYLSPLARQWRHKAACDIAITSVVKVSTKVKGLAQGHGGDCSWLAPHGVKPSTFWLPALSFNHYTASHNLAQSRCYHGDALHWKLHHCCDMQNANEAQSHLINPQMFPRWKQDNGFLSKPLGRHNGIMDQRMTSVLFLKIKTFQCTRLLDIL